jgi:hypothetical protein
VNDDDAPRPLLDDERCSFDHEASRPLDGQGVGGIDDPERLRFSFPTQADGKLVLGIEQPRIVRPGRELDQFAQGHDT